MLLTALARTKKWLMNFLFTSSYPSDNQGETAQEKLAQQDSSADISLDHLPIFDRADLVERMGGDDEGIDEFMLEFPNFLAEDIRELKAALDSRNDLEGILSGVHKIKGMCANASAERVREVAYRIESAAKEGDINAARSLFNLLEQEQEALREYLMRKKLTVPKHLFPLRD